MVKDANINVCAEMEQSKLIFLNVLSMQNGEFFFYFNQVFWKSLNRLYHFQIDAILQLEDVIVQLDGQEYFVTPHVSQDSMVQNANIVATVKTMALVTILQVISSSL